jgi:O-succinylbenzoate synthase
MALLSIAAIDAYRFDIPFVRPLKVGREVLHCREGLLLSLTDEKGHTGFGEIAPLPGLDQVSLERCHNDLKVIKKLLAGVILHPDQFNIAAPCLGMTTLPDSFARHTLFGLESALLSLYLQHLLQEGETNPLNLPDPLCVPINGLFIPDTEDRETAAQISALQTCGMKTVKVKIGRLPVDEEIRQILRLACVIGPDLILRLDGNKNLSAGSYARYYASLRHLNVEYAEEPLQDGETLSANKVSWPIAIDESLPMYLNSENHDLAKLPADIRTVILKPGLLAGLSGMACLIADAKKRNLKIVLSSSFNTGVTLSTLGAFSFRAGLSPDTAHGFDTLRYLQSDVLSASPVIREGVLNIPQKFLAGGMNLNPNVLTKEYL